MTANLGPVLKRFAPGWPPSVDCDPGWHPIIVRLDEAMSAIDPRYTLHQVKEKFGGLRYYYAPSGEEHREGLDALVRSAEVLRSITCEVTGDPGYLMEKSGRRKTLSAYYIVEGWKPHKGENP